MQNKYSINIDDFTGIYKKMAEKANVNGGSTLESVEISIFNELQNTYNLKNETFVFEHQYYDKNGQLLNNLIADEQSAVSTKVYKLKNPDDIENDIKNAKALNIAKEYAKEMEFLNDKRIAFKKDGKVIFRYKRSGIEDYIINDAVDSQGNKITRFSKIPEIRKKTYTLRTKNECKLLLEFNNMIDYAIKAGREYGVDPNLIIAIMQREVGFNGLNEDVVGKNGKGYMQITSIPVKDMLGLIKNNKYQEKLKVKAYGKEIVALFKSRGFDVNCPSKDRAKLASDIMDYLVKNDDPDFNIRLGTIILRSRLKQANGDVKIAAQNYNGNSKNGIKYKYGDAVYEFYNKLKDTAYKH